MSLVNPGGLRSSSMRRVFGFENIRQSCRQSLKDRDHRAIARTSIAQGNRNIIRVPRTASDVGKTFPHEHRREMARRVRQMAGLA